MAYSDFTLALVKQKFSLTIDETPNLFGEVAEAKVSDLLQAILEENIPLALAIATEKARSELLIAPVLVEVRKVVQHRISLFSGVDFNVDEQQGLNGICDFIIARSPEQYMVNAPVIMLVEAKNEDMKRGLGQCLAEMVAARQFNEQAGIQAAVYGVVTTGNLWKFVKLEGQTIEIDQAEYHISQLEKILGILLNLVS